MSGAMKRNLFVTAMVLVIASVAGYNWLSETGGDPAVQTSAEVSGADDQTDGLGDLASEPADSDAIGASGADTEDAAMFDGEGESSTVDAVGKVSDLPDISLYDLPPEALDTIELIYNDGPYPFSKDNSVFQNREGILPAQDIGYYREYTVITPGENHRGARRIVGGSVGELYYTADHYDSFSEIDQNS